MNRFCAVNPELPLHDYTLFMRAGFRAFSLEFLVDSVRLRVQNREERASFISVHPCGCYYEGLKDSSS